METRARARALAARCVALHSHYSADTRVAFALHCGAARPGQARKFVDIPRRPVKRGRGLSGSAATPRITAPTRASLSARALRRITLASRCRPARRFRALRRFALVQCRRARRVRAARVALRRATPRIAVPTRASLSNACTLRRVTLASGCRPAYRFRALRRITLFHGADPRVAFAPRAPHRAPRVPRGGGVVLRRRRLGRHAA
jgi:hypothetical protein